MCAYHIPVLLRESVASLSLEGDSICVDATFGGGGHSRAILERLSSRGRLIAFDQDGDAKQNAIEDKRFTLIQNNFRFVHNICKYLGIEQVDAIFADLGVSSHQFDTCERGFSFRFDSPLDMRMNRQASPTAARVLAQYSRDRLAQMFRTYGELNNSRNIAEKIVEYRDGRAIETPADLELALNGEIPKKAKAKFLAKVYQALRIEVNGEIRALEQFLEQSLKLLKSGGRLSIITYHSLEDRLVKNFLRSGRLDGTSEKDFMGVSKKVFELYPGTPILPGAEEIAANPRARSAKLRAGIKI